MFVCRHGQVVKTLASHAGIRGSTPLGDTKRKRQDRKILSFFLRKRYKKAGPARKRAGEKRKYEMMFDRIFPCACAAF